ncbi:MAG: phosphoribosylaminoimidazolesuccinocarboxamide synthase [Candidatus Andersenbacteria bacterium]
MAAVIPACVAATEFHDKLEQAGLTRIHQGKVRDTYVLPHALDDSQLQLVVATDRVSIFDFVLPSLIPQKGELLTALTAFWLWEKLTDFPHHLVAAGVDIDYYLPRSLRSSPELQRRTLVVRRLSMIPVECIVRGYLTGSGWKSYQRNQSVCGVQLPAGLYDGAPLPEPIFTPTTKAEVGHDKPLDARIVAAQYGITFAEVSVAVYRRLSHYAASKGIIVADTKFEFGRGGVLADEVGTPDSSRFWDREEWEEALLRRQSPSPYDKELVRTWGKNILTPFGGSPAGISNLDPENRQHLAFVQEQVVPSEVIKETAKRYHEVFKRLTECSLGEFQQQRMGIRV